MSQDLQNPFDADSFNDLLSDNDFMRKAQEAEQALTETMVVGRSSTDLVRVRMNCKFERFEHRISPKVLAEGVEAVQNQTQEAYQHAFFQIQQKLKAHIMSLSESMPGAASAPQDEFEIPSFDPQIETTDN